MSSERFMTPLAGPFFPYIMIAVVNNNCSKWTIIQITILDYNVMCSPTGIIITSCQDFTADATQEVYEERFQVT